MRLVPVLLFGCVGIAAADPKSDLRIPAGTDGHRGYIDGNGNVVIPLTHAWATPFRGGIACVDSNVIDPTGKVLVHAEGCEITDDGVALVGNSTLGFGFVDRAGKVTPIVGSTAHPVDHVAPMHGGLAAARSGTKWGYVNARGVWAIQPTVELLIPDSVKADLDKCNAADEQTMSDYERVTCGQIAGSIDMDRNVSPLADFSEGLASNGSGYLDRAGTEVLNGMWGLGGPFVDGRAAVHLIEIASRVEYIDRTGKVVIKGPFASGEDFHEGLAIVRDATGTHVIDVTGKPLALAAGIEPVHGFAGGVAVATDGKQHYGYVGKSGTWAVPPRFSSAETFESGYGRVTYPGGSALVDATGKPLWIDGPRAAFDGAPSWTPPAPVVTPPQPPPAKTIEKPLAPGQARFVVDPVDKDGVRDQATGLEWAAHDNGADIDADGAAAFAHAYRGGGHADWRLPTADELAGLASPSFAHREPNDCTGGKSQYVVTPLVHVSCGLAWSATASAGGVTGFGFISGNPRVSKRGETKNYRALVVRRP